MTAERTRRAENPPRAGKTTLWTVETKGIVVVVPGEDQWEAFDALRSFPKEDFGLLVIAKRAHSDEGGEYAVRTSRLMGRWGRRAEALEFIRRAMQDGLPNTAKEDLGEKVD